MNDISDLLRMGLSPLRAKQLVTGTRNDTHTKVLTIPKLGDVCGRKNASDRITELG